MLSRRGELRMIAKDMTNDAIGIRLVYLVEQCGIVQCEREYPRFAGAMEQRKECLMGDLSGFR